MIVCNALIALAIIAIRYLLFATEKLFLKKFKKTLTSFVVFVTDKITGLQAQATLANLTRGKRGAKKVKRYRIQVVYSAENGGVRTSIPLPEDICLLLEEMEETYPDGHLEVVCFPD